MMNFPPDVKRSLAALQQLRDLIAEEQRTDYVLTIYKSVVAVSQQWQTAVEDNPRRVKLQVYGGQILTGEMILSTKQEAIPNPSTAVLAVRSSVGIYFVISSAGFLMFSDSKPYIYTGPYYLFGSVAGDSVVIVEWSKASDQE